MARRMNASLQRHSESPERLVFSQVKLMACTYVHNKKIWQAARGTKSIIGQRRRTNQLRIAKDELHSTTMLQPAGSLVKPHLFSGHYYGHIIMATCPRKCRPPCHYSPSAARCRAGANGPSQSVPKSGTNVLGMDSSL